jgi:RNA 3'-phosphate cyclase
MIEIEGSYGEGGGALLRISAALSAVTGKSIHVTDIRAKRPKKGLMPQHLNALKSVALLSNAECQGLNLASTEIIFQPNEIAGGDYKLNIGTAGSMTLVLQSFMLPAAFAENPVKLTLKGGSDVRWSPPVDYLANVTTPILKTLGYKINLEVIQRGHYPKGGGILKAEIFPVKNFKPFNYLELKVDKIKGISHSVKLPEHVATRQAKSAADILENEGYPVDIEIQHSSNALGPGSGIVLWTESDKNSFKGRVGSSSIGEPGKKAELVGREAAMELLNTMHRESALDRYMGDQIIPYLALAGHSQIKTAELTQHILTNIYATEKITDIRFEYMGELGEPAILRVD